MSRLSEMIIDLLENPFFLSEILIFCAKNYEDREMSIFESYLIVAIFMNQDSYELFVNTNARGTIQTKMLKNNRISLLLNNYIKAYKENINRGILLMLSSEYIIYDSKECTIKFNKKKRKIDFFDSKNKKMLRNISKIFEKYDYKDIFNLLGVNNI